MLQQGRLGASGRLDKHTDRWHSAMGPTGLGSGQCGLETGRAEGPRLAQGEGVQGPAEGLREAGRKLGALVCM